MSKLNVINLYGGPGCGKSTTAAGIFFLMKSQGFKVELITEHAKDLTYEKHWNSLDDQIMVFAEQQHRQRRLIGQVDWAITDSPLLNSMLYNKAFGSTLDNLVYETYTAYNNYDFLLKRVKPYVTVGRSQTEEEAKELDIKIESLLQKYSPRYSYTFGDANSPEQIVELIKILKGI